MCVFRLLLQRFGSDIAHVLHVKAGIMFMVMKNVGIYRPNSNTNYNIIMPSILIFFLCELY